MYYLLFIAWYLFSLEKSNFSHYDIMLHYLYLYASQENMIQCKPIATSYASNIAINKELCQNISSSFWHEKSKKHL